MHELNRDIINSRPTARRKIYAEEARQASLAWDRSRRQDTLWAWALGASIGCLLVTLTWVGTRIFDSWRKPHDVYFVDHR